MENKSNKEVVVPSSHFEICEFISENKQLIFEDWSLLDKILRRLDELLETAVNMSDLHKDTHIVLETIKMQQEMLLKEIRNEMTLSKLLQMSESEILFQFFKNSKLSSQSITFVNSLDLNYNSKERPPKKQKMNYEEKKGTLISPGLLDNNIADLDENPSLHGIKDKVLTNKKIEFFDLILDYESYSKTVLNAFNLALAIRMKHVSLQNIDNVLFVTSYDNDGQEMNHSVLEITPAQYEKIKKKLICTTANQKNH
ncbi:hypothetical protein GINT2_001693 [Glugoides intestinalis]